MQDSSRFKFQTGQNFDLQRYSSDIFKFDGDSRTGNCRDICTKQIDSIFFQNLYSNFFACMPQLPEMIEDIISGKTTFGASSAPDEGNDEEGAGEEDADEEEDDEGFFFV